MISPSKTLVFPSPLFSDNLLSCVTCLSPLASELALIEYETLHPHTIEYLRAEFISSVVRLSFAARASTGGGGGGGGGVRALRVALFRLLVAEAEATSLGAWFVVASGWVVCDDVKQKGI